MGQRSPGPSMADDRRRSRCRRKLPMLIFVLAAFGPLRVCPACRVQLPPRAGLLDCRRLSADVLLRTQLSRREPSQSPHCHHVQAEAKPPLRNVLLEGRSKAVIACYCAIFCCQCSHNASILLCHRFHLATARYMRDL